MDLFDKNFTEEELEELSYEYLVDLKNSDMEEERARKMERFDQFGMAYVMSNPETLSTLGIIQDNGEITGILLTRKEADIVDRQGGLQKLRANDLRERVGGGLDIHLLEKGGKHRWARVNPNSEAIVREYFERAKKRGKNALLFPDGISNRVDIHACRAEYARDM